MPGAVAARRVTVWEARSGRVWISGPAIDAAGVLHALWPFGPMRPRDRPHGDALYRPNRGDSGCSGGPNCD